MRGMGICASVLSLINVLHPSFFQLSACDSLGCGASSWPPVAFQTAPQTNPSSLPEWLVASANITVLSASSIHLSALLLPSTTADLAADPGDSGSVVGTGSTEAKNILRVGGA
ncbi:unnamed protein product [Protopolystoma xenopodis]|uniref:Secreted protein n=1 Tax=Protopolystoma xenopodis TaxID=117903 RepID=A0A448WDS0_9PLAT|nr:unnamed protein product [Protopolystoma xenopodis]